MSNNHVRIVQPDEQAARVKDEARQHGCIPQYNPAGGQYLIAPQLMPGFVRYGQTVPYNPARHAA